MANWLKITESGELDAESRQLITYFMKNTTEKIFRRMSQMDIHSPTIRNSIHAVVYNNAGGDDALVRFYYLNVARFIELGVGHNFMSDADLGREGVKVVNLGDIPALKSGTYAPLDIKFQGTTDGRNGKKPVPVGPMGARYDKATGQRVPVPRGEHHKARPFLLNTIRLEMRRIAERLATQMAYTHTVYMLRGLTGTLSLDQADKEWRRQLGYIETMRMQWGAMHNPGLEKPFIHEDVLASINLGLE